MQLSRNFRKPVLGNSTTSCKLAPKSSKKPRKPISKDSVLTILAITLITAGTGVMAYALLCFITIMVALNGLYYSFYMLGSLLGTDEATSQVIIQKETDSKSEVFSESDAL